MTVTMQNEGYTSGEINVLQSHVDEYRRYPESVFRGTLEHRGPRIREACELLADKGILEIADLVDRETIFRDFVFDTKDKGRESLAEVIGDDEWENVSIYYWPSFESDKPPVTVMEGWKRAAPDRNVTVIEGWKFVAPDRTELEGCRAAISENGCDEVVRLYREGIIKKKDLLLLSR